MRRRPKHLGTYYAYALTKENKEELPQEDLYKVFIDCSNTFSGIALYRLELDRKKLRELELVYLGVYCDEK